MFTIAALALAFAAPAHCDAGATVFADGPLRVFGTGFRNHDDGVTTTGHDQYACARGGRPVRVGLDFDDGTYSGETPKYVFAGGRYLAAATVDYGEAGPDELIGVWDMRTRKSIKFATGAWDPEVGPQIRLSANGDLLQQKTDDDSGMGSVAVYTRGQKERPLSPPGVDARVLAVAGTTVYWSEPGGARSVTLPGPPSEAPDDVLAPVAFSRANRCDSRPGTTLARTPHVRVLRNAGTAVACRVGDRRAVRLAEGAGDLHVAADRWLYYTAGAQAFVLDMKTGKPVTTAPKGVRWTVLDDGTLAWTDAAGQLQAQRPGAAAATLESAGASALTSSGTTVYWTSGGAAHSWIARA